MKQAIVATWLTVSLLGLSSGAPAEIGAIEAVPAATLLLPYFEVDLDDPFSRVTLFSIANSTTAPLIANVVLWTDWSCPSLSFRVYLTGLEVQTINLRDIFVNGLVPGILDCDALPPPTLLPPVQLKRLREFHLGRLSTVVEGCCARAYGDNVARGYITIDVLNDCAEAVPGDPGYFVHGGSGLASNENQLLGDYFYLRSGRAVGETMVHIEADAALTAGDYTFYTRYSGGADNREGLGNGFAARYFNGIASRSELVVWRDSKFVQEPIACGLSPQWYPLGQGEVRILDEEGDIVILEPDQFPFPLETQRVEVGSSALPVPFSFGWLLLDLNTATGGIPGLDPLAQSWVTVISESQDTLSVGFEADQLSNVLDED